MESRSFVRAGERLSALVDVARGGVRGRRGGVRGLRGAARGRSALLVGGDLRRLLLGLWRRRGLFEYLESLVREWRLMVSVGLE